MHPKIPSGMLGYGIDFKSDIIKILFYFLCFFSVLNNYFYALVLIFTKIVDQSECSTWLVEVKQVLRKYNPSNRFTYSNKKPHDTRSKQIFSRINQKFVFFWNFFYIKINLNKKKQILNGKDYLIMDFLTFYSS